MSTCVDVSVSRGAVQYTGAAFRALIINYYFLAVAYGLHFYIAGRAKDSVRHVSSAFLAVSFSI